MNRIVSVLRKMLLLPLVVLVTGAGSPVMAGDGDTAHTVTFVNNCKQDIWVGQIGNVTDGWKMQAKGNDGKPVTIDKTIPLKFNGRWWPRTGCNFSADSGYTKCPTKGVDCCDTGGCDIGGQEFGLKCIGAGNAPATLFEPNMYVAAGNSGNIDYLDLSMLDGFNVPMQMKPKPGTYTKVPRGMDPKMWCQTVGWTKNPDCPTGLLHANKEACWGPCKYYDSKLGAPDTTTKANICCDNTNTSKPVTTDCSKHDYAGGFGCSPYNDDNQQWQDQLCWAIDKGKHGYWGDLTDGTWKTMGTDSLQFITNIKATNSNIYAWQFDDQKSTYFCGNANGTVDYTVTFCPE